MMKCERTTNQSTAQYHSWKSYISELTIKLNRSYFQIATKDWPQQRAKAREERLQGSTSVESVPVNFRRAFRRLLIG